MPSHTPTTSPPRRRRSSAASRQVLWIATLCVLLLGALWWRTAPRWGEGTYRIGDGEEHSFSAPFTIREAQEGDIDIEIPLRLSALHPRWFRVIADDCLQSLTIDDIPLGGDNIPFCDFNHGKEILLPKLAAGTHIVRARIHNNGGLTSLSLHPTLKDPLTAMGALAAAGVVVVFCVALRRRALRILPDSSLLWTLLAGAALRVIYVLATPYTVRGHDTDGHFEYVRYVAEHWSMPSPTGSWEFWQPPLYYLVAGGWARGADALGLSEHTMLTGIEWGSLALSLAVLALAAAMAMMLFPERAERGDRGLFLAGIAVFPGLIYFAARVNNDVLVHALSFGCLALLLHWWLNGSLRSWMGAAALAGFAILTKSNGLLLAPMGLLLLLASPVWTWRRKAQAGGYAFALLMVMTLWLVCLRYGQLPGKQFLVGNIPGMAGGELQLPNTLRAFTAFNPAAIVSATFNNPWSDAARRQEFWEYLFRSSFFGEFDFGDALRLLGSWMLLLALLMLPPALLAMLRALRRLRAIDGMMLIVMLTLLAGHAAFRWFSPFSTSQDFRYSPLLVIPMAFFVLRGLGMLPASFRQAGTTLYRALLVLCTIFILSI